MSRQDTSNVGPTPNAESSALVVPLHRLGRSDVEVAGGKGANLGELVRAGFPVPPGFVVTTAAYERFVTLNSLGDTIAQQRRENQIAGTRIRERFESAPIPVEVEQSIIQAYERLGYGPVAVRSSATAEDLPQAAFAGQQDTFLNVIGRRALLDSVRRCWASLWTDRALAYRERQGIDQHIVKLAVVIQQMVAAEAAGVMFTANPVTGARDETMIDGSSGLGEAVVSGLVTPDHYVLRKGRWRRRIVERRLGRHEVMVQARAEGGTELVTTLAALTPSPTLPDRALLNLARLGSAVERHFGAPQDIEWAWVERKLLLLQARPITALPEPPPRPGRLVQMLAGIFAEMFPVRPYPLDQTTWVPAISNAAVVPLFSIVGIEAPPIEQMLVEEDGVAVRLSDKLPFRPTPGVLLAPARLIWLARRYDPVHWQADPLLAEARSRAGALEARDLSDLSWDGLLDTAKDALGLALPLAGEMRRRYYPRSLLAAGLLGLALKTLGLGGRLGALLSGVESKTLEVNRALEGLAEQVRSDPVLTRLFASHEAGDLRAALEGQTAGRSFLVDLGAFINCYGHREAVLSTALQPTWKDAPAVVLGIVQGLAQAEPRQGTARSEWEMARDEVLAHPIMRLSPLRSVTLGLLAAARCLWQIREDTHFEATRILPILRRTLLELGRRLAAANVLDAPEDVFHLRLEELERVDGAWPPPPHLAEGLREVVQRRRERRAELEGTPLVDPRLFVRAEVTGDALLSGAPGSPGVTEGPARIVRDASEFGKLRSGEVLVAPYTNPAWTPLFQRAAAVVVDSGGTGSHAAIVAREYGIPAVMGTVDGTHRLADGDQIRVDGTRGMVFRVDPKAEGSLSAQSQPDKPKPT